ncbi:uncharacterized protein DFL_009304 [Arthrobotrys flagrans]|uniref:Uncharacterized protein n=1 Tax=Arthrobotrys flagrans TaxID=97331 RepID=A0A436ZR85_ARTFL|nr:hypothetical protein DFL_009304 [Arthrobotrys flagrans]
MHFTLLSNPKNSVKEAFLTEFAPINSTTSSDIAKCNVSVSFDALVINSTRPWLFAELFDDFKLGVADHIRLSPGAEDIQKYISQQSQSNTQAAEPRSTQHIESHFSSPHLAEQVSVGGPFPPRAVSTIHPPASLSRCNL